MSNLISAAKTLVWLAMMLWVVAVLALWAISKPESAIHQCVTAAQTAALVVAGYVMSRALTEVVGHAERLIPVLFYPDQGGTDVPSPVHTGGTVVVVPSGGRPTAAEAGQPVVR